MKVVEVKTRMLTPASETSSAPSAGVRGSGMIPPLMMMSRRCVVASISTADSLKNSRVECRWRMVRLILDTRRSAG